MAVLACGLEPIADTHNAIKGVVSLAATARSRTAMKARPTRVRKRLRAKRTAGTTRAKMRKKIRASESRAKPKTIGGGTINPMTPLVMLSQWMSPYVVMKCAARVAMAR